MIYRMYRQINDGLDLGFYIETIDQLSEPELKQIQWLIAETFEPGNTGIEPHITASEAVEIGPRLSIETPFSSNAVLSALTDTLSATTDRPTSSRLVLTG